MSAEWINGSLGSLFDTVTGSTPPKSNSENYGDDVLFVKPPELKDGLITETADGLSQRGSSIARVLPAGSILISCIGNLGKVGLTENPVAFNQQINAIKPSETALPLFMFYQSLAPQFVNQLENLASGTTVPIVNKSKFNSIQIVIPSISEQQRIVAILDQAFADIEKARANAKKNLKNARELFDSYLNRVFVEKANIKEWEKKRLSDVCSLDKKQGCYTGLPFVGLEHIESMTGRFIGDLQATEVKSSTFKFTKEHVLYGRLRPYLNKVLLPNFDAGHCSTEIMPLKMNKELEGKYLFYWLSSSKIVEKINDTCTGARMPRANMKEIMSFELPVPSISEQYNITSILDELSTNTQNLTACYESKLASLDELKKSLLQKAFSGELTKTEGYAP